MNTVSRFCLSRIGQPVDLHQRRRVDAVRYLATEQQIQTTRLDDRVERRIRDEVVDPLTHHRQGAFTVLNHLHPTAFELLGQVPGERVQRFVIVVVDVDRPVVEGMRSHGVSSGVNGGKLG
jgi:hypothetical protein